MPDLSVTQIFAGWACGLNPSRLPDDARATAERALLDFSGLCIAARPWPGSGAVRTSDP